MWIGRWAIGVAGEGTPANDGIVILSAGLPPLSIRDRRAEVRRTDSRTHKMLRASLLVALLSPSAAFHLGQHVALRPPAPRLSPVVAAAEKHATVIFLRHGQTLPPSFEAEP